MIATLIAAVSAIASGVAAVAAWRAIHESRRASQATLVATLRSAYASNEMLAAISLIRTWKAGSEIASDSEMDRARRTVSQHFQTIVALVNAELIDRKYFTVVVRKIEADFFCDFIQPMEAKINPAYDRTAFERIAYLYSAHPSTPLLPNR